MDVFFVVLLVLVCAEAARLTELSVQPGQHVTLNCSVDPGDLYWFMEIHSHLRVCIVRTFNSKPCNQLEPQTNKYEGVTGRSLLIRNITADDCRQYFCGTKRKDSIQYEDTFNISCDVPDVPVTPFTEHSEADRQQQHIWRTWPSELVTYSSLTLNGVLILVLTGVFTSLCWRKTSCSRPSSLTENANKWETAQYEEIQLPSSTAPLPAPPSECIYYKVQLPGFTPPPR